MLLNFPNCQSIGVTTFSPAAGASVFNFIKPVPGQIAIGLYSGSTGIEIAGGGASYAGAGYTTIAGVTYAYHPMNSNGSSSLILAANGNGQPIFNTILSPMVISGGVPLWLSAANASLLLTLTFFGNDAYQNA